MGRKILQEHFKLNDHGSRVFTEVVAGVTTFLTMAYITFVNPAILSEAGMDFGAVFVATCVAAALGSLVMGLYANYPIALAPGMGLNAFFTYGVVLGLGYPWQEALGAVFISGVLFLILSVLPVREWIIDAIPKTLKLAISAGIGLFLGLIALRNSGLITDDPVTLIGIGDLSQPTPWLALMGFVLIGALDARRITGAITLGILVTASAGIALGLSEFKGVISTPPSVMPTLLQMDLGNALELGFLSVVLTFLLVDLFDTAGTLVGVAHRAGLLDDEGRLARIRQALLADSSATVVGATLGTSTTTSYIESVAGVKAGGRTGLTAVVVAALFLLCLFFAPLAQSVPGYATAPALLFVACIMAKGFAEFDWNDVTEYTPSVITAICMPLTFSVTNGIAFGFITYTAMKLASGKFKECPPAVLSLASLFVLKFVFL